MSAQPDFGKDPDAQETREWLEALQGVINQEGLARASQLIDHLIEAARERGAELPFSANTPYVNTIPVELQPRMPGNLAVEQVVSAYTRWNAIAMVLRANRDTNVGGHIS
jgi:pyruvate dehydrogenase E1 component